MSKAFYCNQCRDMAYCAEHRICLEAQQPWPQGSEERLEEAEAKTEEQRAKKIKYRKRIAELEQTITSLKEDKDKLIQGFKAAMSLQSTNKGYSMEQVEESGTDTVTVTNCPKCGQLHNPNYFTCIFKDCYYASPNTGKPSGIDVQGSDAVEFHEWATKNKWRYYVLNGAWFQEGCDDTQPPTATSDLYTLFLQSKTNN